jgi:DNA-binding MarR family transcriptional regulator
MTLFKYRDLAKLKGLTPSQRLVLFALAARDHKTNGCFPSIRQIAEDTGLGERTVLRALSVLEQDGYILVDRARPGSHDGNRYELPFLRLEPHRA